MLPRPFNRYSAQLDSQIFERGSQCSAEGGRIQGPSKCFCRGRLPSSGRRGPGRDRQNSIAKIRLRVLRHIRSPVVGSPPRPELIERAPYSSPALVEHMRVNHGRRHVAMTEQFLDRPNVVPAFQEMRGEAVTKRMARGWTRDACAPEPHHSRHAVRRIRASGAADARASRHRRRSGSPETPTATPTRAARSGTSPGAHRAARRCHGRRCSLTRAVIPESETRESSLMRVAANGRPPGAEA